MFTLFNFISAVRRSRQVAATDIVWTNKGARDGAGYPGHRPVMEGWVELVVSSGACLTSLRVRKSEDTEWSLARTGTTCPVPFGAVRQ